MSRAENEGNRAAGPRLSNHASPTIKGARHAETCRSVRERVTEAFLRYLSFQISATCGFMCSGVAVGVKAV
jgi:hypothetical protein